MGEYTKLLSADYFDVGAWCCHEPEPMVHAHEVSHGYHVVFPYRGCYIRESEGRKVFADASRVLFEAPGDEYRIEHPAGGDRCLVVTLRPLTIDWLADRMRWVGDEPRFAIVSAAVAAPLFVLHRRLHRHVRSSAPDLLAVEELVCRVIDHATANSSPQTTQRRRQPERAVFRALELIHQRFREPLTLRDIADYAAYSPFHLTRIFRARTGVPVHRYVATLRLREAFSVLLDGAADISQVALAHGFSSHSHFTAAFGQEFGFPPSELRRA